MDFPSDLAYSREHLWVRRQDQDLVRVGISDFAQDQLGRVIYLDLPQPGDRVTAGSEMGAVESAKSVSDLIAPVSGEVTQVNQALLDEPGPVNDDPYQSGWLAEIKLDDPAQMDQLLDSRAYQELVG